VGSGDETTNDSGGQLHVKASPKVICWYFCYSYSTVPGIYGGKQAKFGVAWVWPREISGHLCYNIFFECDWSVPGFQISQNPVWLLRIQSAHLESKAQRYELQKNNGFKIQLNKYNNKRLFT